MTPERRRNLQDLVVFCLLIGIGVAGRWGQPEWCFTPTAAVAMFAGWYFSRTAIAVMVPVAILAISDLLLPAYDSIPVLVVTYAVMTLPIVFGRLQQRSPTRGRAAAQWAFFGIVPATLFWLTTNFAVWLFHSDYEKSLAGLGRCYTAAIPFYRWMLAGDLFYLGVLLGCWLVANSAASGRERAEA